MTTNVGIIGAGWYGCHLAIALTKQGYKVTIFEKNKKIFSGVSGNFGIRLHKGPHYPRSLRTRESCRRAFDKFCETYPELVVKHEYSTYALGRIDSLGNPAKVSDAQFKAVCHEDEKCEDINVEEACYEGLLNAVNIEEPSIVVGDRLREVFTKYLLDAKVEVVCDFPVKELRKIGDMIHVIGKNSATEFHNVINATGFLALLPKNINTIFDMEVIYQPCLALLYHDKHPKERPFSFIVMDGWFPCVMPYIDQKESGDELRRKYILTHGSYTIMASCDTPEAANNILHELTDEFIVDKIKPPSEHEINRFWPEFNDRFEYIGWKGEVLAKLRTKKEFRSAVTFSSSDDVIHIIPGKVSNIFDAEKEVLSLIANKNCIMASGYRYVSGGVFDEAQAEIAEKPDADEHNTCFLNTYAELNI